MSGKTLASAVVGLLMLAVCPGAAFAQLPPPSDAQFKADIERLLEMTGSAKLGAQMASLVSDSITADLRRSQPNIPDRAFTVAKEVLDAEFGRMYAGPESIVPDIVALYAKYFTPDDVRALLAFYGSPVGQKAITTMPLLVQESAAIGERWFAARAPRLLEKLQERLRQEGLVK